MSLLALQLEAEEFMADQILLEERVEHLQKDVGEMRTDIRRLDAKVDGLRDKFDGVRDKVEGIRDEVAALRSWTAEKISDSTATLRKEFREENLALRKEFQETKTEIGDLKATIARTTGELRAEFKEDLGNLRWQLAAWFVGTTLTGIGLASGIAFGVARIMQPALPTATVIQPAALEEEVRPVEAPAALAQAGVAEDNG